jgi:predicted anti-sigma-YlaC factor YlaD
MHRLIRDHLEDVLAGSKQMLVNQHLRDCEECRGEVAAMQKQAALVRELRAPAGEEAQLDPRAGFYARVMERIEAQGAVSIWNLFFESTFGRRIAVAAMALALLLGVYLVTSEQSAEQAVVAAPATQLLPGEDGPGLVMAQSGAPDQDSVLVNLVTYREQ